MAQPQKRKQRKNLYALHAKKCFMQSYKENYKLTTDSYHTNDHVNSLNMQRAPKNIIQIKKVSQGYELIIHRREIQINVQ